MSDKVKTFTVYDENAIAVEDTFDIWPGDDFFEFNFDNQETPLIDALEAEYGKPMRELSTDCAIYWLVARAMRCGSKEDAVWMRDEITLVWC